MSIENNQKPGVDNLIRSLLKKVVSLHFDLEK